jgi:rubrerythrin
MLGAIRKRDVVAHPVVTIRSFGWWVFLKAVVAGRNQTFLSLLVETRVLSEAAINVPELIGRCAELERSAERIYSSLAERFVEQPAVRNFLLTLSHQERGHAELLEVCRAALRRGKFDEKRFAPWNDAVPRLQRELTRTEAAVDEVTTAAEALRRVLAIESSEINDIFLAVVGASDTEFVRRLTIFRKTGQKHVRFISDSVAQIEPSLAPECQKLLEAHSDTTPP